MDKYYWVGLIVALVMAGVTLDRPAYVIYDKAGKQIGFNEMLNALDTVEIVLFGEKHDDALIHWLELQIVKSLYEKDTQLVLGAEMFEADDQIIIDEYLTGLIEERHLENEAKVWNNYQTDYKPLLTFAKEHHLPFIATNIPRRYASLVARKGLASLDSLPEAAQAYMAPLPIPTDMSLPGYEKMLHMMGGEDKNAEHGSLSAENMVKAQSLKDATMAYFIMQNMNRKGIFVHFNGSYHSDNYEGIYWYLKKDAPNLKIATISSVALKNIQDLPENYKSLADFIIALPEDMTKSY